MGQILTELKTANKINAILILVIIKSNLEKLLKLK